MQRTRFFVLHVLLLLALQVTSAAEDVPKPEPGERALNADEGGKALRGIAETFKAHPSVRAKIRTEVEDLAGKRVEEGELLLQRPSRMLRKFTKPAEKAWLLDGTQISEYVPSQKRVFVKDLSDAPKALKPIQAAMNGDVAALDALFVAHVFSKPGGEGKAAMLRVVLDRKAGASRRLHRRIEARISEGGLFFDEIRYVPDEGDEVTERFLEIKEATKPDDAEFAIPGGDGIERKVEKVEDGQ